MIIYSLVIGVLAIGLAYLAYANYKLKQNILEKETQISQLINEKKQLELSYKIEIVENRLSKNNNTEKTKYSDLVELIRLRIQQIYLYDYESTEQKAIQCLNEAVGITFPLPEYLNWSPLTCSRLIIEPMISNISNDYYGDWLVLENKPKLLGQENNGDFGLLDFNL